MFLSAAIGTMGDLPTVVGISVVPTAMAAAVSNHR